ncbi:hypothetical protein MMC28_002822 [Mycoblastus sanguinarius]|nr:hypothetical protein [Mycoblastus sanguinarius]
MAEAIAVGASVIAIIQISDRIIGLCKFYIESARDASSDLRVILIETSKLKTVFENLKFLTSCSSGVSAMVSTLSGEDGAHQGVPSIYCRAGEAVSFRICPGYEAKPVQEAKSESYVDGAGVAIEREQGEEAAS